MRHRPRRFMIFVLSLALSASLLPGLPSALADDTTVSYNTLRTGWDPNEAGLGPAAVSAPDFGQLFATQLNGQIFAQPIVVAGTVIAATENDWIYGLNPATGSITWSRNVGATWPASVLGCGDLTPNIGITATPVYDPATNSVFFTSKVNDGIDAQHPHWYMHSVDPATGVERPGWPVTIQGTPSNDPNDPFNAETAAQRPGLLVLGGVVYAAFASYCDYGPYVGYVVGVKTTSPAMSTIWSAEAGRSYAGAGIWQSGGGLISDGPGRIIVATGNGVSPPPGPGTSPPSTLAESVVRLQVSTDGTLAAKDFFSPADNTKLDQDDTDFGSGGPMALPDGFGTTAHPHLLVQDGKDGRVFLLDRDNLGGDAQGSGGTDASVGPPVGPYNGLWGHPAFWGGDGGYVYDVENAGYLRAFKYGVSGNGLPVLSSAATSPATFGFSSGSPVVTSSGTTSGSALVWVEYTDGASGANGQLQAYDALPIGGQMHLRWSAPIGTAAKFAVPATDGNRVFVGTRDGRLFGFGRPTTSALTASPTDFGNVAVGSAGTATVTVTAARAVTISTITTAPPFSTKPIALPVTLTTGQTLSVTASFAPTTAGGSSGSLTLGTDQGAVALDLHGTGTRPGLGATPSTLSFGTVPTGAHKTISVSITNTGTSSVTITGSVAPTSPFSASGFPTTGSTLAAGASVSVSVTYTPTLAGNQTGSLSVNSGAGGVVVPISGSAVTGSAHLTITPNPLNYGAVQVGKSVAQSFQITNTGNIELTITKAAPPVGAFNTTTPISEGQQLEPGDVIQQSVTFSPTSTGAATGTYLITGDDGQGAIPVQLTGTGVADPTLVPPPSSGTWHLNGSAGLSGGDLTLTPAAANLAGSAVYPTAVSTDGLHVQFTAQLGGGTGADGLTFDLLDPATSSATSLGKPGATMGFGSLGGVAVVLDTFQNAGDPYSNFVGLANSTAGSTAPAMHYLVTQQEAADLRTGTHFVDVLVVGGVMSLSIDGGPSIRQRVTLPANALLAFSAGTGALYDAHVVRNVTIHSGTTLNAAGWTLNGSAVFDGSSLALTKVGQLNASGSAFPQTALSTSGLHATFTTTIGGGGGADGESFAMLDATQTTSSSIGAPGGGLGFLGLPGVAVTLDTWQNPGDPSNNFVGIVSEPANGVPTTLASSSSIPNLRSGSHTLDIVASSGRLTVSIDGTQILDTAVSLPSSVRVGFTGGSGGADDNHLITAAAVRTVT